MKLTTKAFLVAAALSPVPLAAAGTARAGTAVPPGWIAENMEPVGYIDLEDRLAIKLAITQKGGRWYLFTAYNQEEGASPRPGALVVIDITDPRHPRRIKEIEGPPDTEMAQVSLHGNLLITSMARRMTPQLATGSAQPHPPTTSADEGIQLWDISDPANPRPVGQWETGAYGTHRNSYPGGRYAYAAAFRPGFRGRVMVILDVSDPSHPREVTEWHQYGQKDGETLAEGQARSGGFHGPAQISPDGKMLTTAYAPDLINLDITDIAHPKVIGRLTLTPPFADVGPQAGLCFGRSVAPQLRGRPGRLAVAGDDRQSRSRTSDAALGLPLAPPAGRARPGELLRPARPLRPAQHLDRDPQSRRGKAQRPDPRRLLQRRHVGV
jgi:hypothetical protein